MGEILAELVPSASDTVLMFYDTSGNGAKGNLFFVNQSDEVDYVRVAIAPADQLADVQNYILYDTLLPGNHTSVLQDICLAGLERLYVFSQGGVTSFVYTGIRY